MGLGKPPTLTGRIREIHRKTTGSLIAANCSAFWPVIEWVEEQDNAITNEALEQQFGPLGAQPVDDVLEKGERIHVALLALTGSERFDIVPGAAPSGPEALRRLVRRWDPLSGGTILVPDRCKLQYLSARLQKWEELVRRYDRSKSSGTRTAALDEESTRVSWNSILT